jgi:hypothetical protein
MFLIRKAPGLYWGLFYLFMIWIRIKPATEQKFVYSK